MKLNNLSFKSLKTYEKSSLFLTSYYLEVIPFFKAHNLLNVVKLNSLKKNKASKKRYTSPRLNLFFKFIFMLTKGQVKLNKKFIKIYLLFYSYLLNITHINITKKKNSSFYSNTSLVNKFFGCSNEHLVKFFKNYSNQFKDGMIYNIITLFDLKLQELYLGVSFSLITNVFKGKRKIKNTLLKPIYIFGDKKKIHALKHIVSQILKSQDASKLLLIDLDNVNFIKECISIKPRLIWSFTQLITNLKNSIFYKRKWAIFLKFYRKKAPMYF